MECSLAGYEEGAGAALPDKDIPDETGGEQEETDPGQAEPFAKSAIIVPWREIVHEGDGNGVIQIDGTAKQVTQLVVEITGSGGYRKGEYRYSTDNGESWSDILVISNAVTRIEDTATKAYTGLNLSFVSPEYLIYDVYTFSSHIEYEQEGASRNGEGLVNFFSEEVIYNKDYHIKVKVVKTGGLGEGEFVYSMSGGLSWSEPEVIPANGLFELSDSGVRMEFFDNGGSFMVGDVYETNIKGDRSKRSYMPYIAGALVMILVIIFSVFHHYTAQRDGSDRYELKRYEKL